MSRRVEEEGRKNPKNVAIEKKEEVGEEEEEDENDDEKQGVENDPDGDMHILKPFRGKGLFCLLIYPGIVE